MGIKSPRSLFGEDSWSSKPMDAGLVGISEDVRISLTAAWLEAWDARREQIGEIEDFRGDAKVYECKRAAWEEPLAACVAETA